MFSGSSVDIKVADLLLRDDARFEMNNGIAVAADQMAPHLRYPWFGLPDLNFVPFTHLVGAFLQRDAISVIIVAGSIDVVESQGVAELMQYNGLVVGHIVPRPVPPVPDARSLVTF